MQLVDGSFFDAAATVTWALRDRKRTARRDGVMAEHSHVRLDLRLCGATLLPMHAQVYGKGHSEPAAACAAIEPGVIYVADRGFESFTYLRALLDANADFVVRLTGTPKFEPREDQPLEVDDVPRRACSATASAGWSARPTPAPPAPSRASRNCARYSSMTSATPTSPFGC